MRQDGFRDAGHQVQKLTRMGIAPGPDRRPGVPLGRVDQVDDVAQQDQIHPLDGPVLAVAPPGRGGRQRLQLPGEPPRGLGRSEGPLDPSVRCRSLMITSILILSAWTGGRVPAPLQS